jgi:hypothetical protein
MKSREGRQSYLIGSSGGTKFASRRCVRVGEVAAGVRDVRREVFSARLSGGRVHLY